MRGLAGRIGAVLLAAALLAGLVDLLGYGGRQRAYRAFQAGDYARSLELTRRAQFGRGSGDRQAYDRGVLLYRTGSYASAAGHFARVGDQAAPGLRFATAYNRGNALFRQGEALRERDPVAAADSFRQARESFDRALALAPADGDALHNRALAEAQRRLLGPQGAGKKGERGVGEGKSAAASQKGRPEEGTAAAPAPPPTAAVATTAATTSTGAARVPGTGQKGTPSAQPLSPAEAAGLVRDFARKERVSGILRDHVPKGGTTPVEKDW